MSELVARPPRVLVVDDTPDLHEAARAAAADLAAAGLPIELLHAADAGEALALACVDPALAVAIVGLGGAADDACRGLVRRLRERRGRRGLQLVLGLPPGDDALAALAHAGGVDAGWPRAALTRERLGLCLVAALRRHRLATALAQAHLRVETGRRQLARARRTQRRAVHGCRAMRRRLLVLHDTLPERTAERVQPLERELHTLRLLSRRAAYELRGSLSGVAGLCRLVPARLNRGDSTQVRAWTDMVDTEARRLGEATEAMLTLSTIAQAPLQPVPVALGALVDEARQLLSLDDAWSARIQLDCGPLPTLRVDIALMRHLFVLLLSNGAKFSREAVAPRVTVRAEAVDGRWAISVADNGIGFHAADAGRLAVPFGRLAPRRFEGAGLGLVLAQRIVRRHGGELHAEGRPGEGAILRVLLPAARA